MNGDKLPVVVGITGGSGAMIARQVIALLLDLGYPVIGTATKAGRRVWVEELGSDLSAALRQWEAPVPEPGQSHVAQHQRRWRADSQRERRDAGDDRRSGQHGHHCRHRGRYRG